MSDIREDKQKLNEYWHQLIGAVADTIDFQWNKIVVGFFVAGVDDLSHLQLWVKKVGDDDFIDLNELAWDNDDYDDAIVDTADVCEQLRKFCAESGDRWMSVTFSAESDGSFNAVFSYDAVDKYDNDFIMKWQSEYLL